MRIVRMSEEPKQAGGAPHFTGDVTWQMLVSESNDFNVAIVNFEVGVRNKLHVHSSDQVLIVTSGSGIVASENGQRNVEVGDVIHSPGGEKHWHGAAPGSEFSHITVTAKDSQVVHLED